MKELSLSALVSCGFHPTQARFFLDAIWATCRRFEISTTARLGAFLAQILVESEGLTQLEENLHYTNPARVCQMWPSRVPTTGDAVPLCGNPEALANRVYCLKNGNGDGASGDGWAFRGRGAIQLTGRHNYADAALELGQPYIEHPEQVAAPVDAVLVAGWFWHTNKCNLLADASNWDAITRAINGPGMDQAGRRRQQSADNVAALS